MRREEDLLRDEVEGAGIGEIEVGVEKYTRYSVERRQMLLLLQYRTVLLVIVHSEPQTELQAASSLLHLVAQISGSPPPEPPFAIPPLPFWPDLLEICIEF